MKKLIIRVALYREEHQSLHILLGIALLGLAVFLAALIIATVDPVVFQKTSPLPVQLFSSVEKPYTKPLATQPLPSSLENKSLNNLTKTIQIKSGDTLAHLLKKEGIPNESVYKIVQAFDKIFSVKKLKSGHKISLTYRPLENDDIQLFELFFRPNLDKIISVKRIDNLANKPVYEAKESAIQLEKELRRISGQVNTSVFSSMRERGVSPALINTLIHAFSYDIDFQRDIRSEDSFEVVMERYFDPNTGADRAGEILYASLSVKGKEHKIYYFHPKKGEPNFFTEKGLSIKKAFLRTPVNGARISSGYGRRKHPILGYTKMHKGIDFAASVGTPVMAAGDGSIDRIGRNGSYGNYIRLKHKNGYSTAYAHLKDFGKNLKKGNRVKQGHIIGYVGVTGRTSGPHLHYEVLKNSRHINPKAMANKSVGEKLTGKDLKNFEKEKAKIETKMAKLDRLGVVLTKIASLVVKRPNSTAS